MGVHNPVTNSTASPIANRPKIIGSIVWPALALLGAIDDERSRRNDPHQKQSDPRPTTSKR